MKIKLLLLIFTVSLMTACSQQTGSTIPDATSPPNSASSSTFQAEASSAISVQLTWTPVDGAENYLVEVSFGDDFFPIAYLDAGQTSFEHFPVPEASDLSYRLRAFSGSDEISKAQSLTVSTPEMVPNGLTVQVHAFEPVSPLADFEMPVTDPTDPNFDPEAFKNLLPIDPITGEIDLDALAGEPVNSVEEIGPDGGSVSVTAPDGITYTLMIPEGALEETTFITLTPIETIDDLPLENFLGAVDIKPDGLFLEIPATLTIDFPEAIDVPEGMVTMNFAYSGSGYDFHFVPYLEGDALANNFPSTGGVLAKLAPSPMNAGPLSGIAIQQLGGRGAANGSPAKIRKTIKTRAPSTRSARKENSAAAAQIDDDLGSLVSIPDDDLGILTFPENLAPVQEITARISAANTPTELGFVISDFSIYFYRNRNNSIMKKINEKLWNQLIDKTQKVFDAHKKECITKDAFTIQAIASKMLNAKVGFWKTFREKYVASQGYTDLKEIEALIKKCKFKFDLDSNITLKVEDVTMQAHVKLTVPLKLTFDPSGAATFKGIGSIIYQGPAKMDAPDCPNFLTNVKDLAGSKLEIWDLAPVFDGSGTLIDFKMNTWDITGTQTEVTGKCKDSSGKGINLLGGHNLDYWGGLFTYSHAPNLPFVGWLITTNNAEVGKSGIVGDLQYKWPDHSPIFGGKANEKTLVKIIKLP